MIAIIQYDINTHYLYPFLGYKTNDHYVNLTATHIVRISREIYLAMDRRAFRSLLLEQNIPHEIYPSNFKYPSPFDVYVTSEEHAILVKLAI